MSPFSNQQLKKLLRPLDRTQVRTRTIGGKDLSYIEGWFALAQANAIFGHGGWDRETIGLERAYEQRKANAVDCGYLARVRITVHAGGKEIVREGTGFGAAQGAARAEVYERAIKGAETDATKRALCSFGNQFGLCLYDRDQNGLSSLSSPPNRLRLFAPDGEMCADSLSPHGFCSGLRQLIEACKSAPDILALHRHNAASLSELRTLSPSLRNTRGEHYADILQRLMERTTAKLKDRGFGADEHHSDDAKPTNHDLSRSTAMSGSPGLASTKQDPPAPASNPPPSSPSSLVGVRPSHKTISPADEAKDAVLAASPGAPHQTDGISPAMMLPAPSLASDANGLTDRAHACSAATPSPVPGISKGRARSKKADTLLAPSRIAPGVRIDKSLLVIGHERRLRDRAHLKSVAKLPCLICNRQPCHPHHLKFAQRRGLGQKVSDEFVVPLCAVHHGELHRSLSEQAWWKTRNLDPLPVAAALWANRHA